MTKKSKPTIEPYAIIVLVNQAWAQSFARSRTNTKKAIADRGWYPLNQNLLLNMTLRTSMANVDKDKEAERTIVL